MGVGREAAKGVWQRHFDHSMNMGRGGDKAPHVAYLREQKLRYPRWKGYWSALTGGSDGGEKPFSILYCISFPYLLHAGLWGCCWGGPEEGATGSSSGWMYRLWWPSACVYVVCAATCEPAGTSGVSLRPKESTIIRLDVQTQGLQAWNIPKFKIYNLYMKGKHILTGTIEEYWERYKNMHQI